MLSVMMIPYGSVCLVTSLLGPPRCDPVISQLGLVELFIRCGAFRTARAVLSI
jgi:hypothetical protein